MTTPAATSLPLDPVTVERAVEELARGNLVAFPTETVYGLGADATNPAAVARIFAAKGRPADHPLIVHLPPEADIGEWAVDIPDQARMLARAFWPGPLTLILARSPRVPREVTGGQESVGLRCPSHPIAQSLLRRFAQAGSGAVAAPSANRFGHVSPTTAQHVREEFGPGLAIVDGGACEVGLESTIVDLSRGRAVVLRPGGVTREEIARVLGALPEEPDGQAPRASGTLAAHYAPLTPLVLVDRDALASLLAAPVRAAVLAFGEPPSGFAGAAWIAAPGEAPRYGHDLYANLRRLDASGAGRIVVESPPGGIAWEAVNDRLRRAAAGAGGPEAP